MMASKPARLGKLTEIEELEGLNWFTPRQRPDVYLQANLIGGGGRKAGDSTAVEQRDREENILARLNWLPRSIFGLSLLRQEISSQQRCRRRRRRRLNRRSLAKRWT